MTPTTFLELLAWLLTLPASMILAGVLFTLGRFFVEK